jgi:CHAT domain-containing protein
LARITDRKENLERDLARLLPELARARELDQLGPRDLAAVLPPAAAFVDLLRYTHRDTGGQFTASYVAFVVLPDSSILRVDLQNAGSIDKAVENWRQAISTYQDTPAEAALVARLVWEPLARKLPSGTTTVFLALDGAMVRVPWAALPGSKPGTVLLEELAVVVVPHGPFLLEQLKYPTHIAAGKENVLALGDVDYGPAKQDGYKPLAGTAAEVRQMFAVAGTRIKQELTRERATWAGLKEALPQARYAHLATHGFFNAGALVQEHQRMERQLKTWEFQEDRQTQRLGMGRRSPLSYTGLVLAGANLPAQAQDGGIVTGEALVELPLEGLRLCVLSACESGVGSLTAVAGEGVQGLPRAFHLAGCPNVISSLWNVNDKATAALMARFYHELWVGGKTPLEALRQAQLTILRHPERIDDLADRGRPNFSRLVAAPPDLHAPPGQPAPKRARTKLWAAFMLSGVGR